MKSIVFLYLNDVLRIYEKTTGLSYKNGLINLGLLESAIAQPKATMFGEYIYSDIFEMAAAYFFHIIKNHAFVDGNKRTGLVVAITFLEINGISIHYDLENLYTLSLGVADSSLNKEDAARFFRTGKLKTCIHEIN